MPPPVRRHLSESRFAAVDNGIEPDPSFKALADLLDCAAWKRGDVEVLPDAGWRNRSGENGGAALNPPGQKHLRWGLSEAVGDRDDERVVEQSRFECVAQRRECQQDDPVCLAQFM